DASTQILARTAATDIEMYGDVVREGERVLLLLGSANRDERVFAEPDTYDLDRDTSALISFGSGRHFCLGAALARLEARIVLGALVSRVADYHNDTGTTPGT